MQESTFDIIAFLVDILWSIVAIRSVLTNIVNQLWLESCQNTLKLCYIINTICKKVYINLCFWMEVIWARPMVINEECPNKNTQYNSKEPQSKSNMLQNTFVIIAFLVDIWWSIVVIRSVLTYIVNQLWMESCQNVIKLCYIFNTIYMKVYITLCFSMEDFWARLMVI